MVCLRGFSPCLLVLALTASLHCHDGEAAAPGAPPEARAGCIDSYLCECDAGFSGPDCDNVDTHDAKDITEFTILGVSGSIGATSIALTMPFGTDITILTPTITITGASVAPASGVAQDFSSPVLYTVTAGDSSTKVYTVTVGVADGDEMPQVFPPAMAYYPFEGSADDTAGAHHGSAHGSPIYSPGLDGLGLVLDGLDDYVEVPASSDFDSNRTGEMTFAFDIRSSNYGPVQSIVSRRHPCNNEGHFNLYVSGHRLGLAFYSNETMTTVTHWSGPVLVDGQRYAIVWVKKWGAGGLVRLYVNGDEMLVSSADADEPACTYSSLPMYIGAQASPIGCPGLIDRFFAGTLDEVRVWDRALLPEEIPELCHDAVTLQDGSTTLVVSACTVGLVRSLVAGGQEQIEYAMPLARLLMADGSARQATGFTVVSSARYRLDFSEGETVDLKINAAGGYFVVRIVAMSPMPADVSGIELLPLAVEHVAPSTDDISWSAAASDDTIFVDLLPLNVDTVCDLSYRCRTSSLLDLDNGAVAIVAVPKRAYFDTLRRIVSEQGLPHVVLEDGQWLRQSSPHLRSYLLAELRPQNITTLLDFATRGQFGRFVPITPVLYGTYTQPRTFATHQALVGALRQFPARGIHLGLHTFLNRIEPGDPLFVDPATNLYNEPIGELAGPAAAADNTLAVDASLGDEPFFVHYTTWQDVMTRAFGGTPTGYWVSVDDEVLKCGSFSATPTPSLVDCSRAQLGTNAAAHATGARLGFIPEYTGFFLNYRNTTVQTASIAGFKTFAEEIGARFVYSDASVLPPKPGADDAVNTHLRHKVGTLPYVAALEQFPAMQFGDDGGASFAWTYSDRSASWDGVPFRSKAFTRDSKVRTILSHGPYSRERFELGWWRVHGAGIDVADGRFDYDALSADDVHYAMAKVLALGTSIGVQLGDSYEDHVRMAERFELIGAYQRLIARDAATLVVPAGARAALSVPEAEAYLVGDGDEPTTLVRKAETRRYAVWDAATPFSFTVDNPFGEQALRLELRVRPDYEGFVSSRNTVLADLGSVTATVAANLPTVRCTWDGMTLTVDNDDPTLFGGCVVEITSPDGVWNLGGKRGIGIAVVGDGGDEHLVVSLQGSQFGRRDFEARVDFSGSRELVLGDPTTALSFEMDGDVTGWPDSLFTRSWGFDYRNVSRVRIYVSHVAPATTQELTVQSVLALAERGTSAIDQPAFSIAGQTLNLPVRLELNDTGGPQLCEYAGNTGILRSLSANYDLQIEETLVATPLRVPSGVSTVSLTSALQPGATGRAEVTVILFDDDDGDAVPTDGDYMSAYSPCDNVNSFCDDNCPTVANADQEDSDGDGIGDVCEPAMVYYPFEGSADDTAGAHHGSAHGSPIYSPGLDGLGLLLDGLDDYIEVPASSDFDSNRTDEMTFAFDILGSDYEPVQSIVSRRHPCNNEGHFNLYVSGHRLGLAFYSNETATTVTHWSAPFLNDGERYTVVWVKKWGAGGSARLYVNGVELPVSSADADAPACTYPDLPLLLGAQALGCDGWMATGFFAGQLDEVRLWDEALVRPELRR